MKKILAVLSIFTSLALTVHAQNLLKYEWIHKKFGIQ